MTSKLNANDFKLIYMTLKKAFITRIVLQVFMRKHAFSATFKSMHCQRLIICFEHMPRLKLHHWLLFELCDIWLLQAHNHTTHPFDGNDEHRKSPFFEGDFHFAQISAIFSSNFLFNKAYSFQCFCYDVIVGLSYWVLNHENEKKEEIQQTL